MKQYSINGDTLQKVLNYLATRPYVEVFEIVRDIQGSARELPPVDNSPAKASGPSELANGGLEEKGIPAEEASA